MIEIDGEFFEDIAKGWAISTMVVNIDLPESLLRDILSKVYGRIYPFDRMPTKPVKA